MREVYCSGASDFAWNFTCACMGCGQASLKDFCFNNGHIVDIYMRVSKF